MKSKQLNNSIVIKDISFETRPGIFLFKNLTLAINKEKVGLVGKNGIGKTMLLKMIIGEIKPAFGLIEKRVNVAYLPQDYQIDLNLTVNQTIGAEKDHQALQALARVGLQKITLDRSVGSLSGGERTRVVIASLLVKRADFLILDEPTNNLDQEARRAVYDFIEHWRDGLLVVSHDRELLNLVDKIFELSDKGLKIYGGNYEMYIEQKSFEEESAQRQLIGAEQKVKKVKRQAEITKEKQQKRSSHGKKMADKLGLPKIILGAMKRHAQQTSGKLKKIHEEKISKAVDSLQLAKSRISPENRILVDLSQTKLPNGKLVAELENVNFTYSSGRFLLDEFNISIHGPERLSISGPNGSGKTTLVKLITGELKPLSGKITVGIDRCTYLDQNVAVLNKSKTALENLKAISNFDEGMARNWLAKFLFRREDAFKKVEILSGGERMRLALACVLAGSTPPQLLILDEPTNNLDLNSIEQIESALLSFEGALIVISHDKSFLKNIRVNREIVLS